MKKRLAFLCVCLGVTLAGCGPKPAAPTSSASGTAPTAGRPFVVAYNQWIGYIGLFTAIDKGYFKAAGLDVQPKQFSGPADGVPPLMTGQIDAALTTADTVILLNQAQHTDPTACVYIIDTSDGADGVIAGKDIHTVADLRGKDVAATVGQCNELLLLKALQAGGMTQNDVHIVSMDADTAGAAVMAGKVPAAVTWEPWLTKASQNGCHVIFTSHQAPNTLLDVIAASQQTMTGRAADLRAFIAAYARGAAYAKAHPAEAAQIAAQNLGTTQAEAVPMLTKVKLYGVKDNRALMGTAAAPGPAFASARMIGQFYVDQKQTPSLPDTSKTFLATYLPQ